MKLTKRGKRIRAIAYLLLLLGILLFADFLIAHTKITNCYESDMGRVCGTTWK